MVTMRICFLGDSITAGTGDSDFLGWPGRLSATMASQGHDISCYNLGVRAETSRDIRARWMAEASPRLPPHVNPRLIFSFGVNDIALFNDEGQRISREESLDNARAILSSAVAMAPTLWIGPSPVRQGGATIEPGAGVVYRFSREPTAALNADFATLAQEIGVSYLDIFTPLSEDSGWNQSMRDGDGVHPTADGYSALAKRVGDWEAWRDWF